MTDLGFWFWAFMVLGGTIIVGIAIGYGIAHNRLRTRAERAATERATHQLYEREDRPA
jgi:hypothetical protein